MCFSPPLCYRTPCFILSVQPCFVPTIHLPSFQCPGPLPNLSDHYSIIYFLLTISVELLVMLISECLYSSPLPHVPTHKTRWPLWLSNTPVCVWYIPFSLAGAPRLIPRLSCCVQCSHHGGVRVSHRYSAFVSLFCSEVGQRDGITCPPCFVSTMAELFCVPTSSALSSLALLLVSLIMALLRWDGVLLRAGLTFPTMAHASINPFVGIFFFLYMSPVFLNEPSPAQANTSGLSAPCCGGCQPQEDKSCLPCHFVLTFLELAGRSDHRRPRDQVLVCHFLHRVPPARRVRQATQDSLAHLWVVCEVWRETGGVSVVGLAVWDAVKLRWHTQMLVPGDAEGAVNVTGLSMELMGWLALGRIIGQREEECACMFVTM